LLQFLIVECQPELTRLVRLMTPNCQVVSAGSSLPDFDVHCPLLTLPRVLGTTLETIPADVPYLKIDAGESDRWRVRFSDVRNELRVGLVWSGSPSNPHDRERSIGLSSLGPLAKKAGVRFFSLQKGDADRAQSPPQGMRLVDWMDDVDDFAGTAALLAHLDLTIAVDTSTAHLAVAMAKAVWTLVPFASDWRWLWNRVDSPWYPTMRLFRQPSPGDWESVIAQVADALDELALARRRELPAD
jgi:hypothetical protein